MKKLIEALARSPQLSKVVFGADLEAAYRAANKITPCDKTQFEKFYTEQRAKSKAISKVLEKAAADDAFANVIFGANRKTACLTARKISAGCTDEEFDAALKIATLAATKNLPQSEKLSDEQGGAGFSSWFKAVGGTLLGVARPYPRFPIPHLSAWRSLPLPAVSKALRKLQPND